MTDKNLADADDWIEICTIDSIPVRGSRVIRTAHGDIGLFRTGETDVFALDDRCPHAGGPLSQGIVHDRAVTCPLHNWVINLETGSVLGADKGQVRSFSLRIERRVVAIRRRDLDERSNCSRIADKSRRCATAA